MECNKIVRDVTLNIRDSFASSSGSHIVANTVHVPFGQFAKTLDHVFSEQECNALISEALKVGYQAAGIGGREKQQVVSSVRSSDRLLCEDVFLANIIYERVRDHIPVVWKGRHLLGVNELLRFLKYQKGDFFAPHVDGHFQRKGTDNLSFITLQLYLSDSSGEEQGGATRFCEIQTSQRTFDSIDVFPKKGRVLLFHHKISHEGALVNSGVKYTIRTDVEYGPQCWSGLLLELVGLGSTPLQNRKKYKHIAIGAAAVLGCCLAWLRKKCT
jgi:predicted 2-oxoglutarate/Fe(II)-dependent dioxygenase YbiX